MRENGKRFFTCGQLAKRWGCSIPEVANFLKNESHLEPSFLRDFPNHSGSLVAYSLSDILEFESVFFTSLDTHPSTCILQEISEPLTEIPAPLPQEEIREKLSPVALSNLYTMGIASQVDSRQKIPNSFEIPPIETRRLRAQLILEEAFETVDALGFVACTKEVGESTTFYQSIEPARITFVEASHGTNDEKIIDGCVDTIYVCVGTLIAMGLPDLPFFAEVCRANDSKFPEGKPILNDSGKFLKPEGWNPPDIRGVLNENAHANLGEVANVVIRDYNENI